MGQRQQFQDLLKTLVPIGAKVYFQAPSGEQMVYPCVSYTIDAEDAKYADNNPYTRTLGYQVTVIDRNPDSVIPAKIASMPMTAFNRFFVVDGLNHFVYKTFF